MLKNKVRTLYQSKPELISSDRKLILAQWGREGLHLTEEQTRKFMDVTSGESITRAGRMLREKEGFKANTEVEEQRFKRFVEAKYTAGESITSNSSYKQIGLL